MRAFHFAIVMFVVCNSGCISQPDLGEPVTISGAVTLDGKPLSDATLIFNALEGLPAEHRSHTVTTDAEGLYTIEGVYPAEYMVQAIQENKGAPPDAAVPGVPALAKYGSESPLRAKVTETQHTFNFDLKSK